MLYFRAVMENHGEPWTRPFKRAELAHIMSMIDGRGRNTEVLVGKMKSIIIGSVRKDDPWDMAWQQIHHELRNKM